MDSGRPLALGLIVDAERPAFPQKRQAGAKALRLAMVLPILSFEEAAGRLPLREAEGRAWLVREGLVRSIAGRQVVSWAAVLERLAVETAAPAGGAPRVSPELPMSEIPDRRQRRRST